MALSVFTRNLVETNGLRLLDRQPNAIVRHRILRDILCLPAHSREMECAGKQIHSHRWVEELKNAQHPDGTWGHFHSMDSTSKARFPTSETAIRRGLALGLDKHATILKRAVGFMNRVLQGKALWKDRVEKSEGWPIGVEAITAGMLAEVDPSHPAIHPVREYWTRIAASSFPGGIFSPSAEWKAHKDLRKIGIHFLQSRYVLTLLGAESIQISAALDRQIVNWIWGNRAGIGYLGVNLRQPQPSHIFQWLESLEILSHFQCWREVTEGAVEWLLNQRNADGLWDFGAKVSKCAYFPLSDDWRKIGNRSMDHSVRILVLLRKFFIE